MATILLIASGTSMTRLAEQFRNTLAFPETLSIISACMEEARDYVRRELPEDVDVIIARGNTAKVLKNARISIPVVSIPVRDIELIQSVTEASRLYGKDAPIAYIGLEDTIRSVREFLKQIHENLLFYAVESSQDIRTCILQAKKARAAAVIGGVRTQELARQQGLDAVCLESSVESIREAYERAMELQKGVQLQNRKLQERLTMMNAISDGLISANEKGRITLFNSAAQRIFQCTEPQILGKSCTALFSDQEKAVINRVLLRGDSVLGHLAVVQGAEYTLDFHPILVKKRIRGLLITLRPFASQPLLSASAAGHTGRRAEKHVGCQAAKHIGCRTEKGPGLSLPPGQFLISDLFGEDPASLQTRILASQYASAPAPVLLAGEAGTGKAALAHWIHENSPRREELFLARDSRELCPEDFFSAHRGTLYIRNIEQIPASMGTFLLEYLRTGAVPLSDHTRQELDVRILSGSSVNPAPLLPAGLYYPLKRPDPPGSGAPAAESRHSPFIPADVGPGASPERPAGRRIRPFGPDFGPEGDRRRSLPGSSIPADVLCLARQSYPAGEPLSPPELPAGAAAHSGTARGPVRRQQVLPASGTNSQHCIGSCRLNYRRLNCWRPNYRRVPDWKTGGLLHPQPAGDLRRTAGHGPVLPRQKKPDRRKIRRQPLDSLALLPHDGWGGYHLRPRNGSAPLSAPKMCAVQSVCRLSDVRTDTGHRI